MIQRKVCMLGAFAVGKTSLVRRFTHSIFSEKYLTTVGVKIDKKAMRIEGVDLTLLLWDLHGEDDFQSVRASYLRGSHGCILVADGTRRATLDTAVRLRALVDETIGSVPCVLALNKVDLTDDWQIEEGPGDRLVDGGWSVLRTSAKTGEGVEPMFEMIGRAMLEVA
jgi:small GTP-binding protein